MPRTNALAKGLWGSGPAIAALVGDRPSTPMRGSLRRLCASAPIGAARAAPRPATKARRFMLRISRWPDGRPEAGCEQGALGTPPHLARLAAAAITFRWP